MENDRNKISYRGSNNKPQRSASLHIASFNDPPMAKWSEESFHFARPLIGWILRPGVASIIPLALPRTSVYKAASPGTRTDSRNPLLFREFSLVLASEPPPPPPFGTPEISLT